MRFAFARTPYPELFIGSISSMTVWASVTSPTFCAANWKTVACSLLFQTLEQSCRHSALSAVRGTYCTLIISCSTTAYLLDFLNLSLILLVLLKSSYKFSLLWSIKEVGLIWHRTEDCAAINIRDAQCTLRRTCAHNVVKCVSLAAMMETGSLVFFFLKPLEGNTCESVVFPCIR